MVSFRMRSLQGFTLVEILIAMALFAIISVITYSTLTSAINVSNHTSQVAQRLADIQRVLMLMERDLVLTPREHLGRGDRHDGARVFERVGHARKQDELGVARGDHQADPMARADVEHLLGILRIAIERRALERVGEQRRGQVRQMKL